MTALADPYGTLYTTVLLDGVPLVNDWATAINSHGDYNVAVPLPDARMLHRLDFRGLSEHESMPEWIAARLLVSIDTYPLAGEKPVLIYARDCAHWSAIVHYPLFAEARRALGGGVLSYGFRAKFAMKADQV